MDAGLIVKPAGTLSKFTVRNVGLLNTIEATEGLGWAVLLKDQLPLMKVTRTSSSTSGSADAAKDPFVQYRNVYGLPPVLIFTGACPSSSLIVPIPPPL